MIRVATIHRNVYENLIDCAGSAGGVAAAGGVEQRLVPGGDVGGTCRIGRLPYGE